jgi:DNA transposase THAP9
LQATNQYLKKKVKNITELLNDLSEKSLIDKEERRVLGNIGVEEKELLKRQMQMKDSNKLLRTKYSPELRCFALTLNYYSPKAYKYVRKTFGTCLPHPRTLSKWYSNIDGKPGFTKEALNALKITAEQSPDKIYCALIFDEIKIKHHTEWDPKTQRFYGYVEHGFDLITDNSDSATDALVFLLVGINKIFKIPIGYFLVKGTTGSQKAQLVTDALALVSDTGVEVKALTCDGAKANLAMAEELGCCFEPTKLQTSFLDPSSGQNVHFFLDPCHVLKLVRNSFEHYGCFTNASGEEISWSYLEKLHNIQEEELFYMANKLRANHIHFKMKIMSVKLAAQLFSESVADALLFCKNKMNLPEFMHVTATAKFIKLVNDVFDILDSRTRQYGLKRALSIENYENAFGRLDEAFDIFHNLFTDVTKDNRTTRVNLLQSPRYTGFLGILICIISAKAMFESLILNENTNLTYLPMHKISQDHIEIFFSVIRSHGGYSDNPTARQFEATYKKLLIHGELQSFAKGTNCTPLEKMVILNCSSSIKKINQTARNDDDISIANLEKIDLEEISQDIENEMFLSPFGEKVLEYVAGFVVFSITKKVKCINCIKGLLGPHNKQSLTYQKSRGYLVYASNDVINICRQCEILIRRNLDDNNRIKPTVKTAYIVTKALNHFKGKDIFPTIEQHVYDNDFVNHNMELGRLVMQKYTDTRISYLMKKTDPQKCIRHIYNKLIHFKNQ